MLQQNLINYNIKIDTSTILLIIFTNPKDFYCTKVLMDIMLKVLKSNFEEEIMEEINSSFIKIDKNKESISNLSRKNDKIYSDLSLTKAELLKYLTIKLDNLKSKHFLTLFTSILIYLFQF